MLLDNCDINAKSIQSLTCGVSGGAQSVMLLLKSPLAVLDGVKAWEWCQRQVILMLKILLRKTMKIASFVDSC